MGNIRVLPAEIYNLIAAGEVIERPVGAVKELVENSVDAGAQRIVIEVRGGGFDLISVADNGCGMRPEDVELAFLKHATSKLTTAEQLYAIETLGFRGEALASIAAVSRVKLTTRHGSCDSGESVTVENGKITDREYVPANVGTKFEVRNLFYNTPARKKFFKSNQREGVEITKFVSKFILSNPNIEVSYILDGKQIYQTRGKGLEEAVFAVYGEDCLSNCLEVSFARDKLFIKGYIGSPEYTKPNKTYQTLSVNGRCVTDSEVSGAIMNAFRPYLMTRKFPFYVLNLEISCDEVDVNIHPKKSEVKFSVYSQVPAAFYRAVESALKKYVAMRTESILGSYSGSYDNGETVSKETENVRFSRENYDDIVKRVNEIEDLEVMNPDQADDVRAIEYSTMEEDKRKSLEEFALEMERENTVANARKQLGLDVSDKNSPQIKQNAAAIAEPQRITDAAMPNTENDEYDEIMERVRILGVAFKTYLILEIEDKIVFVDQHAAHERILFDKFMEGRSSDMQPMLFPYVFSVKDEEAEFIDANKEYILRAGIDIEPFGRNTYRIASVSTLLADTKMKEFVEYLLSGVDDFKLDDKKLIVEKIAKKACKAAVKAGYSLNEYEIRHIVQTIYENKEIQCPHGRPITYVMTKTQLEKAFKRIV